MSVYELIAREASDQMEEDGRPLTRYILTPRQFAMLADELKAMAERATPRGVVVPEISQITLWVNSQKSPIGVIKGPH